MQRGIVAKAVFGGDTPLEAQDVSHLSEQQAMLDDALRRMLQEHHGFEQRQSLLASNAPVRHATFAAAYTELGLHSLIVPERDGGYGGSLVDVLPVMEALGEHLVLEPVLWASLLPTQLVMGASGFEGRGNLLQALMQGEHLPVAHQDGSEPLVAKRVPQGFELQGRQQLVLGANDCQRLLLAATLVGGGQVLLLCDVSAAGLTQLPYRLHDGRWAADLVFDGVCLPSSACVADVARSSALMDEALAMATVALCADSLGSMRQALALTVEYMRTRKQFGKSLSEQQALQHRVVEHFRDWTNARALVQSAAQGWNTVSATERIRRVSAAKWMTGEAGRRIALDVLQLHGAIGFQNETEISHHARRLVANDRLLGDAAKHLSVLVDVEQRFAALMSTPNNPMNEVIR